MIHAFRAQRFEPVPAECDLLGDQNAGAALLVEVGEIGFRHVDREGRQPRQRGEADFGFELVLAPIAEGIGEIARHLDEEIGVKRRVGPLVLDRQEQLLARVAGVAGLDGEDACDGIVGAQRSEGVERARQEIGAGCAQRTGVRGDFNAGCVA